MVLVSMMVLGKQHIVNGGGNDDGGVDNGEN